MIYTKSGFEIASPALLRPEYITITDVCWGLAHLSRWNGQTVYPWTEAQHSLEIARLAAMSGLSERDALSIALYNAPRAYGIDPNAQIAAVDHVYAGLGVRNWADVPKAADIINTVESEEIDQLVRCSRPCMLLEGFPRVVFSKLMKLYTSVQTLEKGG